MKEEVRRRLTFSERVKKEFSESYREILTRIEAVPSVSVHVRRGGYLHASHNGMYEGICTLDYYRKAMAQIREKEPEAVFSSFPTTWNGRRSIWPGRTAFRWRAEAKRRGIWTCI